MTPWLAGQQKRMIVHQICQLQRCHKKQLRINTRSVQRQRNGVDCGVFAIAFAVELAFCESPEKYILDIYCACRKPFFEEDTDEDKENFVIGCSKCGECYQKECEQVHSQFFKDEKK